MKIMITGAGGFLGTHLVEALRSEHDLICPTMQEMDLRHWPLVLTWVKAHQPDVVLHLAAKTEVALSFDDFEDFTKVNYTGTVLLAEANRIANPNLKQFVFASTMETYGDQEGYWKPHRSLAPFDEDTPQNPCAPYAVAKVAAEKYLRYLKYAYGQNYTILRQTNTYGRTGCDFFVMEKIISQMIDGCSVVQLGDPEPWRNFLFIDDLVDLYRCVIGNPKALNETFVTGPNNALSIEALAEVCADLLDYKGEFKWYTMPERPGEIRYLNSTAKKAETVLGWKAKTALYHGICETAKRMKAVRKASAWEYA